MSGCRDCKKAAHEAKSNTGDVNLFSPDPRSNILSSLFIIQNFLRKVFLVLASRTRSPRFPSRVQLGICSLGLDLALWLALPCYSRALAMLWWSRLVLWFALWLPLWCCSRSAL